MVLFVLIFSPDEKCDMVRETQNTPSRGWCFPGSLVDFTLCSEFHQYFNGSDGALPLGSWGRARLPSALLLLPCCHGWALSRAGTSGILLGRGQ